ncbi:efflux transporter outer membrane subunit [uncultured Methylovirgula sp.]|uniref:efflux transporter outer membrane subunit n=1 Tax=uncultured Methylovirgula sp. TaxID=1285960 RepID=UPI0026293030|nr:efflux transporter outer membrane subunit [uncultured Methylovirgula sp.]
MKYRALSALAPALVLAACDLAPAYRPPVIAVPVHYKEAGDWQLAAPRDDHGPWWQVFRDPKLDELEPQVEAANQDLAAARANYLQARDFVAEAQAALYPHIGTEATFSDNRQSNNRPTRGANEPDYYGANTIDGQASYEVDLWGRIRDNIAAHKADAQASLADLAAARLSLQAELARDYLGLRGLDREIKLLRDTVAAYSDALKLTQERLSGKIGAPIDVARAEVQLDTARAQLADLSGPRALFEHAIATLIGRPASTFTLAPTGRGGALPTIPHGVPSTLLERRPDIAAAERETAAANESIGIARAAFFPRFTINLFAGEQDTGFNLVNLGNSLWSVGPSISLPLFDAGRRQAHLAATEAAYLQTVAQYRATVLKAIQEVEDNLALLRSLRIEAADVDASAVSAQRASNLALTSYKEGGSNFLDVIIAQTAALDAQRAALLVSTRRMQTSVALILALGGDWSVDELAAASDQ